MTAGDLNIGPLTFDITADPGVEVTAWPGLYTPFLGDAIVPSGARRRLTVRILAERPAGWREARPVFAAGRAWALRRDASARYLGHAPHGWEDARWVARLAEDFESLAVGPAPGAPPAERHPLQYPLDQLLVMYRAAREGEGLLVHAAGVEAGGRLYLFAGCSGAGKSTLSRLLMRAGVGRVLSDDRLLLWRDAGGVIGYGTPWPGTERIAVPAGAPLAALVFLEHGADNTFRPLTPRAAVEALLPVSSVLWHEPELMSRQLECAAALAGAAPAWRWPFTPDDAAVTALGRWLRA